MKRMTAQEIDDAVDRREEIQAEEEKLRCKLQQQVEEFGFTPTLYQFTLSRGLTTEVKDAEVERIRENCPPNLFDSLFRTVTKYKLADGATTVLAGRLPPDAPRNLRLLF